MSHGVNGRRRIEAGIGKDNASEVKLRLDRRRMYRGVSRSPRRQCSNVPSPRRRCSRPPVPQTPVIRQCGIAADNEAGVALHAIRRDRSAFHHRDGPNVAGRGAVAVAVRVRHFVAEIRDQTASASGVVGAGPRQDLPHINNVPGAIAVAFPVTDTLAGTLCDDGIMDTPASAVAIAIVAGVSVAAIAATAAADFPNDQTTPIAVAGAIAVAAVTAENTATAAVRLPSLMSGI